jgi:DNA-binding IclR family transcriptional regulator
MARDHDVQALSDVDIHVYEAVAAHATAAHAVTALHPPRSPGIGVAELCHSTGLEEQDVRRSLATLIAQGYVVPRGDGFGLGQHTFGVER